jgi:hypothetical protein
MATAMGAARDLTAEQLAARGLSPAYAEHIARRYVEGFADCVFEAARKDSEARGLGLKEFLDGAEVIWTRTAVSIDTTHVPPGAVACVANVSQQAGLPPPAAVLRRPGATTAQLAAPAARPLWAVDMEALIRNHIASHPEVPVERVVVNCLADGCNVLLAGRDIPIFDLEFDVFAENNGFRHAVVGGDTNARSVWLQR